MSGRWRAAPILSGADEAVNRRSTSARSSTCSGGTFLTRASISSTSIHPFKSNQDYNVLFAEQSGAKSAAQIRSSRKPAAGIKERRRPTRSSWKS